MNTIDFGKNTQLWLDRLASGELDEITRKSLLAWLDAEPLRWRACALAFLEVQTWNESFEIVESAESRETCGRELRRGQQTHAEQGQKIRAELRHKSSLPAPRRWAPAASLAAAVLVAFACGALSRGWWTPPADLVVGNKQPTLSKQLPESEPAGRMMATILLNSELQSGVPATMQIPVRAVDDSAAEPTATPISQYDRQKWERRGYQLTKERRFVPAQLPSGKKVVVPVEQVKANYVGSKVS